MYGSMLLTRPIHSIRVYLNGGLIGEETKDLTDCFRKNKTGISQAKNVMVGSGAIWDDEDVEDARFDNVKVYFGALTAAEIQTLYEEAEEAALSSLTYIRNQLYLPKYM